MSKLIYTIQMNIKKKKLMLNEARQKKNNTVYNSIYVKF